MLPALAVGAILGGGALLGGLGGASAAGANRTNTRKAMNSVRDMQGNLQGQYDTMAGGLDQAYSPYTNGAAGDMAAYRAASSQYDPSQYAYDAVDPFAYDLNSNTQKFLDPTMDLQIQNATKSVEASAANRGGLFSSATGKSIADRSQDIARQSWKEALQTAMADRGFQYGAFSDQTNWGRQAKDQQANLSQQKLGNLSQLAGMGMQATTNLAGTKAGLQSDMYTNYNNADLKIADIMANRGQTSGVGGFLSGAGTGLGMAGQLIGGLNAGSGTGGKV